MLARGPDVEGHRECTEGPGFDQDNAVRNRCMRNNNAPEAPKPFRVAVAVIPEKVDVPAVDLARRHNATAIEGWPRSVTA
jgi:hypothetical protein